jgi:hypothetical protein
MSSKSMLDPIVRALVGVDRVHHGVILDVVNKLGGQDAAVVRSGIAKVLRGPIVTETVSPYLTHLNTIDLAPTKGRVTIAKAKNVFKGFLDPQFKNFGTDVVVDNAHTSMVDVYVINRDGIFSQIFGSLGDPLSLCLTQAQVVEFCRSHRDQLRMSGYSTFFLCKGEVELFVASVRVTASQLEVHMGHFGDVTVFDAGYHRRLVVRQQ